MYENLSKFRVKTKDGDDPAPSADPAALTEDSLEEKKLVWSTDYAALLKRILETFPVTQKGDFWIARSDGSSFSAPTEGKAVRWSVDQFIKKLNSLVDRTYKV